MVKLLGLLNACPVRSGLTENGIRLMLQLIGAASGLQPLDLLEALSLFPLSALFQKLLQVLAFFQQLSLVEMLPVIEP